MIFLAVLLVIAIVVALFYRSKAKEFESLFELSKGYEPNYEVKIDTRGEVWSKNIVVNKDGTLSPRPPIKYNKDGSIAKKRGRKPKVQK